MPLPAAHMVRWITLPIVLGALVAACFVNESEESPGNDKSQDVGLHIALNGNFVLNRDGSRVITSALAENTDGSKTSHLIGVAIPEMTALRGPSIDGMASPEIMLTPDPNVAWVIGFRDKLLEISALFMDTMTSGPALVTPDGAFNGAILSGDGESLALVEVWDANADRKLVVLDVPTHPKRGDAAAPPATDIAIEGGLFDVRFTRDGQRMLVLTVPVNEDGDFVSATRLTVFAMDDPDGIVKLATFDFDGFTMNLLGVLTWAIRISPDGHYAALSGHEDELDATKVIDLDTLKLLATFECNGPVGFTPDSATMIGFRNHASTSELVISDLAALTSEAIAYDFRHPIYWISSDGTRVVTYPFGGRGLVISDLDTGQSTITKGDEVSLNEFVVSPDTDFIYLVDKGALYLLDIEIGDVELLEPARQDYDNINILPDGEALILSAEDTTRFDLWDLTTARTEASVTLNHE